MEEDRMLTVHTSQENAWTLHGDPVKGFLQTSMDIRSVMQSDDEVHNGCISICFKTSPNVDMYAYIYMRFVLSVSHYGLMYHYIVVYIDTKYYMESYCIIFPWYYSISIYIYI